MLINSDDIVAKFKPTDASIILVKAEVERFEGDITTCYLCLSDFNYFFYGFIITRTYLQISLEFLIFD